MSFSVAKSHLRHDLSLEITVSINQESHKHLPSSSLCPEHLFFSLDYFWCPPGRPQPFWRTHASCRNTLVVQPRCRPAAASPAWAELPRLSFILSSPTLNEVNFDIFTSRAAPHISLTATGETCHVLKPHRAVFVLLWGAVQCCFAAGALASRISHCNHHSNL